MVALLSEFHWTIEYTLNLDVDQLAVLSKALERRRARQEGEETGSPSPGVRSQGGDYAGTVGPPPAARGYRVYKAAQLDEVQALVRRCRKDYTERTKGVQQWPDTPLTSYFE